MKRLFTFNSKPKQPERLETLNSTSNIPKVALSPIQTSPTISRRPTMRSEGVLWRSLQVIATEEGLFIRPRDESQHGGLKVAWQKNISVTEVKGGMDDFDWTSSSLTVHGILGTVTLFSGSYVLLITAITDLGNLCSESRRVYGVKEAVYIPLDYARANAALTRLISRSHKLSMIPPAVEELGSTIDAGSLHVKWAPQHLPTATPDATSVLSSSPTSSSGYSTPTSAGISVAPLAKVLSERLSFWKSKSSTTPDQATLIASKTSGDHETLGELLDDIDTGDTASIEPAKAIEDIVTAASPEPKTTEERDRTLEEKILRETVRQFTRGGMYFSYSFDLSNSLQRKQQQVERLKKQEALLSDLEALGDWSTLETCQDAQPFKEPLSNQPLWKRVDRRFWWNEHLLQPFIEAELHSYILPILQGHFQLAKFQIPLSDATPMPLLDVVKNAALGQSTQPGVEVEYAVISRRSKERAGLRYQRRGIDDDAHVANFVETEAVLRLIREETENVFSFVQIRGSIPLYWYQSGYGLKPPALLDPSRSQKQNLQAMKKHMSNTTQRYGPLVCVNLAEQHGVKEGPITEAYRERMKDLKMSDARYHQWDFHAECKGMKYENISKLTRQLERTFEQQGFYWISGSTVMSQQKGVFRVNCIDCLDRTNVVQSAFARHVLTSQLEALALINESGENQLEVEHVFNDVWANNGDSISREYAGTSALKGDYTRTGKRDLGGLLNDGINSLARVYTSTFSDWFSQSVIDFMLGYRGTSVFAEFVQKLATSDTRDVLRLSKIREAAIEHASSMVVLDEEKLTAGWTLMSPSHFNVRIADKFEEKILILTTKAVYIVSYDYSLEKVKMSTRIPLGDIVQVQKGAYILSTLNRQTQDPLANYGMVVSFLAAHQDTRVTSYSIRNKYTSGGSEQTDAQKNGAFGSTLSQILSNTRSGGEVVTVAFKSLPVDTTQVYSPVASETSGAAPSNAKEAIEKIVELLTKACGDFGVVDDEFLREEDVVSAAEAQKSTTLIARFEYNFKRLLWLGS